MTALAYFPRGQSEHTVPVVCPACGTAFPVPVGVLRAAKSLGCPACRHIRPAPSVPPLVGAFQREERISEFPTR